MRRLWTMHIVRTPYDVHGLGFSCLLCGADNGGRMMDEPRCLVIYKVGEYTGALWVANGVFVHGCFRAHGHGEFDLNARRVGGEEWVCLEEGLNYNFGRVCDVFVQGLLRLPETEESVQLLRDIGWGFGERYVSGGGFVNFLMEVLFCKFESQDVGGSDFFRVVCEDSVFEGVVGEVRVEWNRLLGFVYGEEGVGDSPVMDGCY